MKKVIIAMSLLASSYSYAGEACAPSYASGIGHVLRGMARPIEGKKMLREGETAQDNLYTVKVESGVPYLYETRSGKSVELLDAGSDAQLRVYATQTLRLYPDGVPGADREHQFVIILCADESAF